MTGKIFPDDEGPLQVAVFIQRRTETDSAGNTTHNDQVVLNFGKSVKWLSVGKPELAALIKTLQEKLEQLP